MVVHTGGGGCNHSLTPLYYWFTGPVVHHVGHRVTFSNFRKILFYGTVVSPGLEGRNSKGTQSREGTQPSIWVSEWK